MVDNAVSEQEGRYDILENNAGEIMIIIKYREGGPENPRWYMTAAPWLCYTAAVKVLFCLIILILVLVRL